jgi:non-specific serine/threonine protein kinase/serine/threonine-protein kinase
MTSGDRPGHAWLFSEALKQPAGSRDRWLEAASPDAATCDEVRALLRVYDEDPGFLEAPIGAAAAAVQIIDEREGRRAEGRRLGPYRLVREIGRGGMGVVYEGARDDAEFARRVAIKLLPAALASATLDERFRLERQVLAGLDHPNIARLFDAGSSDDGVPYLVMEYVDGQPIDAWCRGRQLTIRQRVELVLAVCEAVAHAHQNLVIHRDLKAANILVTAQGQPKLLDFGIATLISEQGQSVGTTRTGQHSFTPEYASPEQVRGERVTTASDVYSLGVLLYVILAARPPHALADLTPLEALRAICEVDPPVPSSVAPPNDQSLLRGDLDAIVLKALRKEPAGRYRSVFELDSDLRAWLDGRPVTAGPATIGYRARKFVGRHRVSVAAAAVAALAILGGGGVAVWQARVAAIQRDRAETRSREGRQFSRALLFDVNEALSRVPGNTEPRRLLLDRAVQFLDGLATDAGIDASLKLELAEGYRRLGSIQGDSTTANVGNRTAAATSFEKAARLTDEVLASRPDDLDALILGMKAQFDLQFASLGLHETQREAAAKARHRELLQTLERRAQSSPRAVEAIAEGYTDIASALESGGDYAAAEKALMVALPLYERIPAGRRTPDTRERHAFVLKRLGAQLQWLDRFADAERRYREALALDEEALAARPGDPDAQWGVTVTLSNLGSVLSRLGRRDDSLAPWTRALEMRRALVTADPKDQRAVEGLAMMLSRLSSRAYEDERFADSVAYNREKVRLVDNVGSREGATPRARSDRALARLELVMALVAQADAGSTSHAALLAEAREILKSSPADAFTTPSAFSAVPVEAFREARAGLARRLGVADTSGPAARP